jgi:hypothetical protein
VGEARDCLDDVGALVHDDDGTRAETGLGVLERVKVHAVKVVYEHACHPESGLALTGPAHTYP